MVLLLVRWKRVWFCFSLAYHAVERITLTDITTIRWLILRAHDDILSGYTHELISRNLWHMHRNDMKWYLRVDIFKWKKKTPKSRQSKNMINAHLPPYHLMHCKHNQNNIENINTYEQVYISHKRAQ